MSEKKADEKTKEKARPDAAADEKPPGSERSASDPGVTLYDPRKPNRLNRKHLKNLSDLFQKVAEDFAKELGLTLRLELFANVERMFQERFESFNHSLEDPICMFQVEAKPLHLPLFCLLEPVLVFTIVDRFLGGSGEIDIEPRELTLVETGIASHLVDNLMSCFRKRWKKIGEIESTDCSLLNTKMRIEPVAEKEIVLVVDFRIFGKADYGKMTLCVPFGALESHLEAIGGLDEEDELAGRDGETWRENMECKIAQVEVGLPVVLGEAEIPLGEVLGLRVNDVIVIDRKIDEPVNMLVGSRSVIRGNIGIYEDRLALRVSEVCTLDDNSEEVETIDG